MAYDPNEPRDAEGRWTDAGDAIRNAASDNKFSYIPNKNLSTEQSKIEANFFNDLNNNFSQRESEYLKANGNVISADLGKDLSPDYIKNKGELSAAVHEPASAFVKKVYENLLARKPVSNSVIFTAGGSGAGKTTGIDNIKELKKLSSKADIIYDSNLSSIVSAKTKIDQALKTGRDVTIIHVHRDVVDAFENGVIPRMIREGRSVPISEHMQRHVGSLEAIKNVSEYYKNNGKVKIVYVDNSLGRGNSKISTLGSIEKKAYISNRNQIETQLHESVKRKRESGQITAQQHRGLITKT